MADTTVTIVETEVAGDVPAGAASLGGDGGRTKFFNYSGEARGSFEGKNATGMPSLRMRRRLQRRRSSTAWLTGLVRHLSI